VRRNTLDFLSYDGVGRKIDWRYLVCEASLSEINGYLLSFDSYQRTAPMAHLMSLSATERPEHCIRIFLDFGDMCDAPWGCRSVVADALRRARGLVNLPNLLEPDARTFYVALPGLVSVWRGCQRGRERGLSWTTDRSVAEGFARGKRCIQKNPTLVHAEIPKQHIFAVFTDRNEHEVALDPRRLRKLTLCCGLR
jgi:hypothetical protein